MTDVSEFIPASTDELCRFVAEHPARSTLPLTPVGGGTGLDFGRADHQPGVAVRLERLTQVVDYPARDMTITVEAGIRMADLAAALRREGQRLPVDVPHAERATLGGALATNVSGPRRYGHGTWRDYVIGVGAVDARGRLFHAGGRVVKNVAGYDLCKLLVGSFGTLGIVTQVTLKLRPEPEAGGALWCSFPTFAAADAALAGLGTSAARPIVLDLLEGRAATALARDLGPAVSLPHAAPVLVVGVEGTQRDVRWQLDTLKRELAAASPANQVELPAGSASQLWSALTEYQAAHAPASFKANLRPSATAEFLQAAAERGIALQAHAGNGIVHGHLPDDVATAAAAQRLLDPLRQRALSAQGNLVVRRCPAEWKRELPVFGHPPSSWSLMHRLKRELDPHDLLNRRRLFE